jgi:hypothetical protein
MQAFAAVGYSIPRRKGLSNAGGAEFKAGVIAPLEGWGNELDGVISNTQATDPPLSYRQELIRS